MTVWKGNRQEIGTKLMLTDTENGMMWPQQLHRQICASFITIRLFPTAELFYRPPDQRHSPLPMRWPQASPGQPALYKINFIFWSRKYKFLFLPEERAGGECDQLREAQLGGSFPCALNDLKDLFQSSWFFDSHSCWKDSVWITVNLKSCHR